MSQDEQLNLEVTKKEQYLNNPLRVVVQLDRYALKFLDLKGTIAHEYFSPNYDISWAVDAKAVLENPLPSFREKLIIATKDEKKKITITFDRLLCEYVNIGSDILYLANDVSRQVKKKIKMPLG